MSTFEQKLFHALQPKRSAIRKRRKGGARRGRIVDPAYLAWMAQQPPLVGSGPVTVHHVRRFGEPKDDRRTVPLPAAYHMHDFGPHAIERLGKAKFQEMFGVDLEVAIALYNDQYERYLEPEPPCTCVRLDVDLYDASWCDLCNPSSEYNRRQQHAGVSRPPAVRLVMEESNGDSIPF